jgi:hypothetical protein
MIQTAEYVEARIIAVLQAFLPTELTTIYVTEMGSDLGAAPSIPAANYYAYELEGDIPEGPSITVNVVSTSDLAIKSITNSPGLYHALHTVEVGVHVKDSENEGIASLKKHMQRIVRGVERVLAIRYFGLENAGVRTVVSVKREGDLQYLAAGQAPGQYVRSGKIPFTVETYENL